MFVCNLSKESQDPAFCHRDCSKCLSVAEELTLNQIKDLFEPLLVVHTSSNISTSIIQWAHIGSQVDIWP